MSCSSSCRVSALGTIFGWLGRIATPSVRTLLESAADRLAAANTSELVRLLNAPEQEVALEAVRRAGSLQDRRRRAGPGAPAPAGRSDHASRAVLALAEIGTPGAMQHLDRGIDDEDREVRIAAVRALGNRNHRQAVQKIEAAIGGRRLQAGDLTEKMAYFEAFGALCGEAGVPMLDGLLNKKGLFGKREDAEVRACAAMALGRIGTDAAHRGAAARGHGQGHPRAQRDRQGAAGAVMTDPRRLSTPTQNAVLTGDGDDGRRLRVLHPPSRPLADRHGLRRDARHPALSARKRGRAQRAQRPRDRREDAARPGQGARAAHVGRVHLRQLDAARLDLDNYASFSHLLSVLRKCGVGTISVTPEATARDWLVLLSQLLSLSASGEDVTVHDVVEKLEAAGVATFTLGPPPVTDDDSDFMRRAKEAAKRTYSHSVAVTKECMGSVRLGQAPNIKKIKRVVQTIVDQILNEETSLVGLTTIRDYDEYTFTHSVNVCIFSVALGRRLGLSKLQLFDLGLAALFHDIGKSRVPLGRVEQGREPERRGLAMAGGASVAGCAGAVPDPRPGRSCRIARWWSATSTT